MVNSPLVVVDSEETVPEEHVHRYVEVDNKELTTMQLRKLVYYRGRVGKCDCGVITLWDSSTDLTFSRNGSRL